MLYVLDCGLARPRVADGDGDKFYTPIIMLEGRDEEGVILALLRVILVAFEVPVEPNLYEDEGA